MKATTPTASLRSDSPSTITASRFGTPISLKSAITLTGSVAANMAEKSIATMSGIAASASGSSAYANTPPNATAATTPGTARSMMARRFARHFFQLR